MSTLQELLSDLEKGSILQSSRGESLRLVGTNKVEWIRSKGYYFEPEIISMSQARALSDVWSWHVLNERTNER